MRNVIVAILAAAVAMSAAAAFNDRYPPWDLERLSKPPATRAWPKEFDGGATPIMLEGEPYKGRPTWCFAYYGVLEWATEVNKAPAIVLVHGGLGTAYPEWVRMWVRRGYAAICVDTCGAFPMRTEDGEWMANPEGGPRAFTLQRRNVRCSGLTARMTLRYRWIVSAAARRWPQRCHTFSPRIFEWFTHTESLARGRVKSLPLQTILLVAGKTSYVLKRAVGRAIVSRRHLRRMGRESYHGRGTCLFDSIRGRKMRTALLSVHLDF